VQLVVSAARWPVAGRTSAPRKSRACPETWGDLASGE
jgi:hypothetical protein